MEGWCFGFGFGFGYLDSLKEKRWRYPSVAFLEVMKLLPAFTSPVYYLLYVDLF
jgi:hypothetical protein